MSRLFRTLALCGIGLAIGTLAFSRSGKLRTFIESAPCAEQFRALKKHPAESVAQPV